MLAQDALAIWKAGVDAVRADRVISKQVHFDRHIMTFEDQSWSLKKNGKLIIVGAGKAAFMMLKGLLESARNLDRAIPIVGWINVPEGTVTEVLDDRITVCQARPAGMNEPTPKAVEGTASIRRFVSQANSNDTVICLISGGGSALLTSPIAGVSLDEKRNLIRLMSQRGANIEQLNLVRRGLSQVKGGRLVKDSTAGQWITLIISDVLGDPLESIASGPTVLQSQPNYRDVLATLQAFDPGGHDIAPSIYEALDRQQSQVASRQQNVALKPVNLVLANNASAVDAAGIEAVRRGYAYCLRSAQASEGPAELVGADLARQTLDLANFPEIQCLISGGEPTVTLPASDIRGVGGRNQQLVLAALQEIQAIKPNSNLLNRFVLLSGGTDGEDGPTDATGAYLDSAVIERAKLLNLDASDYLRRCDAYRFFERTGSLIKTGPTHTNVCDLRVSLLGSPNA
jgi:glycerate 2-kinase